MNTFEYVSFHLIYVSIRSCLCHHIFDDNPVVIDIKGIEDIEGLAVPIERQYVKNYVTLISILLYYDYYHVLHVKMMINFLVM